MSPCVLLVTGALLSTPQPAETVETIVEKHIDARGGLDRIRSIRTLRAAGRMRLGGRTEATFALLWKKPRRARVEMTIRSSVTVQVLDGDRGWWVAPLMGMPEPVPLPAERVGQLVRGVDLEGPIVDYGRKGHRVQLLGRDSVEGIAAWKLEVTTGDGTILQVFFDAERFLEIKEVCREPATGLDLETTFSDYKLVDGLMMPHQLTSTLQGNPMDTTVIESIVLNAPVDDAEFRKPKPGPKGGDP